MHDIAARVGKVTPKLGPIFNESELWEHSLKNQHSRSSIALDLNSLISMYAYIE